MNERKRNQKRKEKKRKKYARREKKVVRVGVIHTKAPPLLEEEDFGER